MSFADEARREYGKARRRYNRLYLVQMLLIVPGSLLSIVLLVFNPFWGAIVGGAGLVTLMVVTLSFVDDVVEERERHLMRWIELEALEKYAK